MNDCPPAAGYLRVGSANREVVVQELRKDFDRKIHSVGCVYVNGDGVTAPVVQAVLDEVEYVGRAEAVPKLE